MSISFNYVSALAGAGKTHQAINHSSFLANSGMRTIIAQPSMQLIDESFDKALWFQKQYPNSRYRIKKIHSNAVNEDSSVAGEITNYLKNYQYDAGEILFITHAALFNVPYFHRKNDWKLIIDEIPDPFTDLSLQLPDNHSLVTSHFDLKTRSAYYSDLTAKPDSEAHIKAMFDNKGFDKVNQVFNPLLTAYFDEHKSLFVNSSTWMAVAEDRDKKQELPVSSLLLPSYLDGFKDVTVMGAMFEESILAQVWNEKLGVEWSVYEPIQNYLRYQNHAKQPNLSITYLMEENWSKTKANQKFQESDYSVFQMCMAEAEHQIGDNPHILITNKAHEKETDECFLNGSRVSNVSHGINTFQHIDNAIFLSALNPKPSHFKLFEMLDVTSDELADARYHQIVYQAVMRTSLRDPDAIDRPKHIVVPDKRAADYLARVFPGCKVQPGTFADIEIGKSSNGRPKGKKDASDRKPRARFWDSPTQKYAAQTKKRTLQRQQNRLTYDPSIPNRMSLFSGKWDKYPTAFEFQDSEELIAQLREMSEDVIESKEHNLLISPAHFVERAGVETRRGLENIESIHGVWLDNDGGDLSPIEFRDIFPTLRMAIFSTYSGGNRYRVFIPTSAPMLRDTDFIIKCLLMNEIRSKGYGDKGKLKHGFDTGKLTPSSMFYLPGFQHGKADEAFFIENPGDVIDVDKWLDTASIKLFKEEEAIAAPVEISKAINPNITLQSIAAEIQSLPAGTVNGTLAKLVVKAFRNGFEAGEIRVVLGMALSSRVGGREHMKDFEGLIKKGQNGKLK